MRGGNAQMAAVAIKNNIAVTGILFATPPNPLRCVVCICEYRLPAPKNNNDLNNEWLTTCNNVPHRANVATMLFEAAEPSVAIPRPINITPMFSILEYASNRFTSFCKAARITPQRPVTTPTARMIKPAICNSCTSLMFHTTRITPYTPVLIITPDIIAET